MAPSPEHPGPQIGGDTRSGGERSPTLSLPDGLRAIALAVLLVVPTLVGAGGHYEEATPEPDLTIVDLTADPGEPTAGDRVTFTASVRNDGYARSWNTTARFEVGNTTFDTQVPGLNGGESALVQVSGWEALAGDWTVNATVDPGNDQAELDEANNGRALEIHVAPPPSGRGDQPDLQARFASAVPVLHRVGEKVFIGGVVENVGSASAPAFSVSFELDGETFGSAERIQGLEPGERENVLAGEWTSTSGPHTIRMVVDAGAEVAEPDEANNLDRETFTSLPALPSDGPELLLTEIEVGATSRAGTQFWVHISNVGDGSAGAFEIAIRPDYELARTIYRPVSGLDAGQTVRIEAGIWPELPKEVQIDVLVDALGDVLETSEDPAWARTEITVDTIVPARAPARLGLSRLWIEPSNPQPGDAVTAHAALENLGDEPVGPFAVRFERTGIHPGHPGGGGPTRGPTQTWATVERDGLGPGAITVVSAAPWNATQGYYELALQPLSSGTGSHADFQPPDPLVFGVQARPDLRISAVVSSPPDPDPGQRTTFEVAVENVGDAAARTFTLRADDGVGWSSTETLRNLAPGARRSITISDWTATSVDGLNFSVEVIRPAFEADTANNAHHHSLGGDGQ